MRRPTRAKAASATRINLSGKWRITEMDLWAREAIDLVGPAFIEFKDEGGQFRFIAVDGWMDCRHGQRDGQPSVDFTWDGNDEGDPASGRSWVLLRHDGSLTGHIYFRRSTRLREPDPLRSEDAHSRRARFRRQAASLRPWRRLARTPLARSGLRLRDRGSRRLDGLLEHDEGCGEERERRRDPRAHKRPRRHRGTRRLRREGPGKGARAVTSQKRGAVGIAIQSRYLDAGPATRPRCKRGATMAHTCRSLPTAPLGRVGRRARQPVGAGGDWREALRRQHPARGPFRSSG